ncbi:hypothetical protein [Leucobacter chromiireducens]|uniref:hypothetical protein n=1 Tax=Leucobacter chromiireducens TaxID=283877 RepID=UPI000F630FBB|nr:hypothetical protein [Leucobacter chromiireducens]
MAAQKRILVVALSVVAFIALTLSVPTATKDSFFVLYGLRFQVNNQVRPGEEIEALGGLISAVLLLLLAISCLVTAVIIVHRRLPPWDLLWPLAALVGGLILGLIMGQVNGCLVYFPAEVCRPGDGY